MGEVVVLRYGHRAVRDYRVTTHCCLVARAFGAKKIIIIGQPDKTIEGSIKEVVNKWGGNFTIGFAESWRKILKEYRDGGFAVVHLTMYGAPIQKKIKEVRKNRKVLVIIGAKKVEREVYDKADYNVAIASQPHSEIAALAIFLDGFFGGKELEKKFPKAKIKIVPQNKGKKLRRK